MKSKIGRRITYVLVFLFICMAITTVAVKAPEPDKEKSESTVPKVEKEVRSDVKVKDDKPNNDTENNVKAETPAVTETPKMQYSKPVFGEISAEYSMDKQIYSKTMDDYRTHQGVDIKANSGDDVYAAEKGIVSFAGVNDLMGQTVKIKHPDDSVTVYSGLKSTADIVEGQEVQKGQVIGKAGGEIPLESKEGTHIHFEIIKEDVFINPLVYIK